MGCGLLQQSLGQKGFRRKTGARLDPSEGRLERRGSPESVPVARKNVPRRESHHVVPAPNDADHSQNFDAPHSRLNFFNVVVHYASPIATLPRRVERCYVLDRPRLTVSSVHHAVSLVSAPRIAIEHIYGSVLKSGLTRSDDYPHRGSRPAISTHGTARSISARAEIEPTQLAYSRKTAAAESHAPPRRAGKLARFRRHPRVPGHHHGLRFHKPLESFSSGSVGRACPLVARRAAEHNAN